MKRKRTIILGILLFGCLPCGVYAQEAITSGGGEATGNGSASFSIGQAFYTTNSGASASAASGVQQAYEISSVGVTEYDAITLECTIYPNPTSNYLTLDVNDFSTEKLDYVLYDISGRVLENQRIDYSKTVIDMMDYPNSTYFLKVSNGSSAMKTFKIIKN